MADRSQTSTGLSVYVYGDYIKCLNCQQMLLAKYMNAPLTLMIYGKEFMQ